VISAGPGWRWVLFVNLPVCTLVLARAFRLIDGSHPGPFGRKEFEFSSFDTLGAILGTAGIQFIGVPTAANAACRRRSPGWRAP
jgi:hypothetical protein